MFPDESIPLSSVSRRHGLALADVVAAGKLTLTLAARHQLFTDASLDPVVQAATPSYDSGATTPAYALMWKFSPRRSVYGNAVTALEEGPTAPVGTVNANQVFAPSIDRQYEFGAKGDFGGAGATLAFFDVTQAFGTTNPATNIFSIGGRHVNHFYIVLINRSADSELQRRAQAQAKRSLGRRMEVKVRHAGTAQRGVDPRV